MDLKKNIKKDYCFTSQKIAINNFNLIRLILASVVIYSHSFVIYYGKLIDTEPGMIFTQNQIDIGGIAVNCFFIISGFLIFKSYESHKSTLSYLKARIYRIYPGFIVAFSLSILLIAPLSTIYVHKFILNNFFIYFNYFNVQWFLIDLITLQAPHAVNCFKWMPLPGQINESLWTIQYEFACYLLLPLLGIFKIIKNKWLMVALFFILFILLTIQNADINFLHQASFSTDFIRIFNPVYVPRFLVYFLAGSCFYIFFNNIKQSNRLAILSFFLIIISCIWLKCLDVVLPFAGTYLLFFIAYHPKLNFSDFTKNRDLSYGVYLYAWPIQQSVMLLLFPYLNPHRLFFITLPIAFFVANLSWQYVEKRFLAMKKTDKFIYTLPLKPKFNL